MRLIQYVFTIALVAVLSTACSPKYIKGTEVPYSADKQAVSDTVERYRQAVIQRDTRALRALASDSYYENSSTTNNAADVYDRKGFENVLSELKKNVKAV